MRSKFVIIIGMIAFVFMCISSYAKVTENAREGMPENHTTSWDTKHQQYAKVNQRECADCHKPIFCIDCHQRRDDITERVHKGRNWKFYHSIEARTNPRKCDSCHQRSYCTDCHTNPR